MKKEQIKIAGLALALFLSPGAARAVEVYKSGNTTLDLGLRMQLLGTAEYASNPDYVAAVPLTASTGNGNRDTTRIFLFQKQNRLTLNGNLDGTKIKFEAPFGSEAYTGSNNLYTLHEFSAEVPVNDSFSVVAGLSKMPWNVASATFDQTSLFTGRSELFNLFFNAGYDTTVFAKGSVGAFDAILGVEQGAPNLAQRYIPELLVLPVPVFARIGFGNLKEDPTRFRQMDFGKLDSIEWGVHANGFWAADSSAGHGTLFSQMGAQAELSKGPFETGNFMFQKGFNPLVGYTTGPGGLSRPDNQFWTASLDSQLRLPLGDDAFVFGAQWNVAQYIAKGMNAYIPGSTTVKNQPVIYRDGKRYDMNYGQVTVQGGELYFGYVASKWAAAARLDVLLPDPLLGTAGTGVAKNKNGISIFGSDPVYEITFPSLSYKLNSYTKLVAETEFTYNAPEAIDTDGIYQLKTVPVEYALITAPDRIDHEWLTGKGRLMLQVAF
jgi:hypothetical protein